VAVRVYELAKELGIDSKALVTKLGEMGEFVRSPSSTIEAPVVRKVREAFPKTEAAAPAPATPKTAPAKPAPAAPAAPAPLAAAPVAPAPERAAVSSILSISSI